MVLLQCSPGQAGGEETRLSGFHLYQNARPLGTGGRADLQAGTRSARCGPMQTVGWGRRWEQESLQRPYPAVLAALLDAIPYGRRERHARGWNGRGDRDRGDDGTSERVGRHGPEGSDHGCVERPGTGDGTGARRGRRTRRPWWT